MSEQTAAPAPTGAQKGPAAHFSGTAWITLVVPAGNPTDCLVGNVTFEPGCRNNWHSHPAGQLLLVTDGEGFYQEKGQPARRLRAGDSVAIAPGVVHWHGATNSRLFTHLAIGPNASRGLADWGAPVTEEEYQTAHGQ